MNRRGKECDDRVHAKEYWLTQSTLSAITSLASAFAARKGNGFFLSGPFGSGKTRFLMTVHELSETQGALPQLRAETEVPGEADWRQIQLVGHVFRTCRIAPCYLHLGGANRALSAELLEAVKQQHLWGGPDEADLSTSLDVVDESLVGSNRDMLLLLVDELAPFLDRKTSSEALQDMVFLQRLGEGLPDHRVIIVLAVHKNIDALDDLRYDQLEKFKKHYCVLPLHVDGALAQRYSAQPSDSDLVLAGPLRYLRETHWGPETYGSIHDLLIEPDVMAQGQEGPLPESIESELGAEGLIEPRESRSYGPLPEARPPTESPATAMDPVRRLAGILRRHCDPDDLDSFLKSRGIREGGLEAQVVELCAMEDPVNILAGLFTEPRLRRLAAELGLQPHPGRSIEELCTEMLANLGFPTPRAPTGINAYKRKLMQLQSALQLKNKRPDIIGIGSEGCDDVGDQILRDIIAFYCTVLMGEDYEQTLGQEGLVPGEGRPHLDDLTFGQKLGVLERLDGYLKRHPEAKSLMRRWFGRAWVVKNGTHLEKYLSHVSRYRNNLAHPQGIDTLTLKDEAGEALRLLTELSDRFEEERVYPPVIAVEAVQIDRYGRRIFMCVDDRGCEERLFTGTELEIGGEYFFYPVTNPLRVDPLIIRKH